MKRLTVILFVLLALALSACTQPCTMFGFHHDPSITTYYCYY